MCLKNGCRWDGRLSSLSWDNFKIKPHKFNNCLINLSEWPLVGWSGRHLNETVFNYLFNHRLPPGISLRFYLQTIIFTQVQRIFHHELKLFSAIEFQMRFIFLGSQCLYFVLLPTLLWDFSSVFRCFSRVFLFSSFSSSILLLLFLEFLLSLSILSLAVFQLDSLSLLPCVSIFILILLFFSALSPFLSHFLSEHILTSYVIFKA